MIGTRENVKEVKTIIRGFIIVLVICAIGGYAGFQSKKIISGPQITIQSPMTTSADNSAVDVSGIVKNVSVVTLNDRLIPIDEAGQFKEKVLLYPGYNVIKVKATDKFGSCVTKELQVVYTDSTTSATSTVNTVETTSTTKDVHSLNGVGSSGNQTI